MMRNMDFVLQKKALFSFLALAGLSILRVDAQTVTLTPTANNLYNTGYAGTVQAGPNQPDTHYQVVTPGFPVTYQANPLAGGWVANPVDSQWITVTNPTGTAPSITYDYRLTLTNIPVGRLVTIGGLAAADDNVIVSVNGSAPFFSNFNANIVPGNYAAFTAIPSTTFVSGTSNTLDFIVSNNGGFDTGLNLQLTGSYMVLTSTVGLGIQILPPDLTPNQQAVINYINQLNAVGVNNACFTNLTASLLGLDGSTIGAALDELSPEKLGIFSSIAFNNASFLTQGMDDYLAHRRTPDGYFQANPGMIDTSGLTISDPTIDPQLSQIYSHLLAWNPPVPTAGLMSDVVDPLLVTHPAATTFSPAGEPWNVFIQGNVILGQDFSSQDLSHADSTTSAVELGADYQFSPNFLMGAFFNYNHTDVDLDENGSSATVDSYSPGIYASYAKGGWYGNFLADYSHNAYTEQRNINIGNTYIESPSGAPEGDQETVNLDGGYDCHDKDKKWTYGPTLGLQYTHFGVDSFTESGGCSSDLAVDSQSADSFRSRLGGHVSYMTKSDGLLLTPFLDASWQHEFLDDQRGITSSFNEIGGGQFTVYTPSEGRESVLLATGLNIDIDDTTTVFTNYQVQVNPDDYFGQSIIAGVKVAF
jgi:uncharacterized protein YhjY with autotransporter beta-barrel domain